MLRQKRRAVSPYKRPDNCNGVGRNLANRYQANRFPPDFKDDDGSPVFPWIPGSGMRFGYVLQP